MRHRDFERIRNEFVNYYKNQTKGEYEYYEWLRALQLDESLPYNQTRESFTWAKDMISLYKEDVENKYYKVLLAFPTTSMNGNVYKERELLAAAMRVAGKSPDMNHKPQFWFSPDNIYNRWGTVTTEGAKYEDGAVELVMKVPKKTLCPVCTEKNKPLHKLIDEKKIVNVSLNGFNQTEDGGFQFDEKIPYTLLTSNVLPGIPMARIFPIEAYLPFSRSHKHKRQIKIIGLEKTMKEQHECPEGQHWDEEQGKCVDDTAEACECPEGQHWDETQQKCVANEQMECPEGSHWNSETQTCVKDEPETPPPDAPAEQAMPENQLCPDGEHWDSNLSQCVKNTPEPSGTKFPPELTDTAVGDSVAADTGIQIQGEQAQLKVDKLKLEQKIRGYELSNAELTSKLAEAYTMNNQKTGEIRMLTANVAKLERQITGLNREKAIDTAEIKTLNRRLEDMTESRDSYKQQAINVQQKHETLDIKYRELLKKDLALEQKLTDTNEEIIEMHRQLDKKEATIRKQKSLANKIRITGLNKE